MQQLLHEGLAPSRWSNDPDAVYALHEHPYRKVLVVVAGAVTFTIGLTQNVVMMRPGDRLELPPHTPHSAVVGPKGVVCFEAQIEI